jgi:hypothetical protein
VPKRAIKIKEINYFERLAYVSARKELVERAISASELSIAQTVTGKVVGLLERARGTVLRVELGAHLYAFIDELNISDSKAIPFSSTRRAQHI